METRIKQIPTGKWKENCYVINNRNKDALIIDPGADKKSIVNYIEYNNLKISAILNTHAHYDHIGAVQCLKDKFHAPFFLHSEDEKLLRASNLYVKMFDGSGLIEIPGVDYFYEQSDVNDIIENFSIKVIFTPGHTQGSVCLLIDSLLFTGDTLLNGKIGRTDLPGGDRNAIKESLKILMK